MSGSDEKQKSRRPANTAFKQQRLKAWQPLLTPKTVLPSLILLGILFAPFGGFLLYTSSSVSELIIDYTTCFSKASATLQPASPSIYSFASPDTDVSTVNLKWMYESKQPPLLPYQNGVTVDICTLQFTLPAKFSKPVFLYYRLTNFYQNHRRYVKSFDPSQLKGLAQPVNTIESNCSPFGKVPGASNPNAVYYPCGLIANSIFNDSISSLTSTDSKTYAFSSKGIAWPSDRDKYGALQDFDPEIHIPPADWVRRNGTRYTTKPNFKDDERLQVWMRTAGLPNFRKLYGKNTEEDLLPTTYTLKIEYNYNVVNFGGTKSIVISTVSFMGGRNPFLGYAYVVAGGLCILLAVVFSACHLYAPRKLGDHTHLSWNQQQQQQQQQSAQQAAQQTST